MNNAGEYNTYLQKEENIWLRWDRTNLNFRLSPLFEFAHNWTCHYLAYVAKLHCELCGKIITEDEWNSWYINAHGYRWINSDNKLSKLNKYVIVVIDFILWMLMI